MKLTKERAITLHRRMWRWIGLKTLKEKECIWEYEWFEKFGLEEVDRDNYCCEYQKAYDRNEQFACDHCPLEWGGYDCSNNKRRNDGRGLLGLWEDAAGYNNWQEAGKLALQIANLPERKPA